MWLINVDISYEKHQNFSFTDYEDIGKETNCGDIMKNAWTNGSFAFSHDSQCL
jgi:hypothetical protein